jgi:hypothetical protein
MNELNQWETRFRSWTPRRPSAGLKARVLGRGEAAASRQHFSLGWLGPATACLLLLFVTVTQRSGELARLTAASDQLPIMAVTLSNVSLAAYLPGSFANDQNAVRPDTFEWTNHGHSPSSIPSFLQARTNYLKR